MARCKLALILIAVAACEEQGGGDNSDWLTAPTPQTHEKYFPILSDKHMYGVTPGENGAPLDCNTCHGAFDTFTQFTCLNTACHVQPDTDPHHTTNPDYSYDSVACYGCHPWGTGDSIDHTMIFPIGSASQHFRMCTKCHDDPSNHQNIDCMHSGCHVDPAISAAHTSVGVVDAYQPVSMQCLRCHADSQVDRVASHVPFRINARHNDCIRCHPATRTDRPYPAQDFHVPPNLDCFQGGCHNQREIDNGHAGRPGFDGTPMNCIQAGCHPNGGNN
jgi:hypothetical protein